MKDEVPNPKETKAGKILLPLETCVFLRDFVTSCEHPRPERSRTAMDIRRRPMGYGAASLIAQDRIEGVSHEATKSRRVTGALRLKSICAYLCDLCLKKSPPGISGSSIHEPILAPKSEQII
jgi:hypothetical protein